MPERGEGVQAGLAAIKRKSEGVQVSRTEQDTPMNWVIYLLIASVIPLFMVYFYVTKMWVVSAFMAVVMLVAGFLFSAVAAYMAGNVLSAFLGL